MAFALSSIFTYFLVNGNPRRRFTVWRICSFLLLELSRLPFMRHLRASAGISGVDKSSIFSSAFGFRYRGFAMASQRSLSGCCYYECLDGRHGSIGAFRGVSGITPTVVVLRGIRSSTWLANQGYTEPRPLNFMRPDLTNVRGSPCSGTFGQPGHGARR